MSQIQMAVHKEHGPELQRQRGKGRLQRKLLGLDGGRSNSERRKSRQERQVEMSWVDWNKG